jgi:hypothetical protein
MVTLAGVEPATCGLGNRRSIHLSYRATDGHFTLSLRPVLNRCDQIAVIAAIARHWNLKTLPLIRLIELINTGHDLLRGAVTNRDRL